MVLSNFNHSYISKYILKFTLDAKIDEFEKNIFPPSKQCASQSLLSHSVSHAKWLYVYKMLLANVVFEGS